MPEFYKNIEGFFDFESLYYDIFNNLKDGFRIAEIGCYKGKSACFLGELIKENNKQGEFFCIDHFKGNAEHPTEDIRTQFENNILKAELDGVIVCIPEASTKAAQKFNNEELDFVFIDADHSYNSVMNDLRAWFPKIKKGGILAGHDIWTDVWKALCTFFGGPLKVSKMRPSNELIMYPVSINMDYFPSWFCRKI